MYNKINDFKTIKYSAALEKQLRSKKHPDQRSSYGTC